MHKGRGTEKHDANPSEPVGDGAIGHGQKGGEQMCGGKRQAEVERDLQT